MKITYCLLAMLLVANGFTGTGAKAQSGKTVGEVQFDESKLIQSQKSTQVALQPIEITIDGTDSGELANPKPKEGGVHTLEEGSSETGQQGYTQRSGQEVEERDQGTDNQEDTVSLDTNIDSEITESALPGEDVNFNMRLQSSTHHILRGRTESDIGKLRFNSFLMPSYEVKFNMTLKQPDIEDVELTAYFDLANYTMETDGQKAVLNKNHKQLMRLASIHLESKLTKQYEEQAVPEHGFMLIQMMKYWSVAPEGYVIDKQSLVSH